MSDEPYTPFGGRQSGPAKPIPRRPRVACPSPPQRQDFELWPVSIPAPDAALARAAEWKQMVLEKGYEELGGLLGRLAAKQLGEGLIEAQILLHDSLRSA